MRVAEVKSLARRAAKAAAAGVVHYSGLRSALARVRRFQSGGTRVLIVSYHRVVADFERELQRSIPGLLISRKTFRGHLEEAHRAGYQFASIGEAVEVLQGQRRAKRDLCVVTFDDGYRDVYRYAYPVLKQLGIPAITYLPTDFIGTERRFNHDRLFHLVGIARQRKLNPLFDTFSPDAAALLEPILLGKKRTSAALDDYIEDHSGRQLTSVIDELEQKLGGGPELTPVQGDVMDWDEVRAMARDGFDFGAHTLGHTVLTLEDPASVDRELGESKATIERELGKPVVDFAYCNGWYSDELIAALKRHGFRSAVTTEDFPNRVGEDPFALKRKVLWENFSIGLTGGYSACLTACQLDDVFGLLGVNHPVPGKREQHPPSASPAAREVATSGLHG